MIVVILLVNCTKSSPNEQYTFDYYFNHFSWFERNNINDSLPSEINENKYKLWRLESNNDIVLDTIIDIEINDSVINIYWGHGVMQQLEYTIINKNTDSMVLILRTDPVTYFDPCGKNKKCSVNEFYKKIN
jgi:hypothetical protein